GHRLGLAAGRLIFEAREALADFFAIADSSRIVFTANATEAINLALFGLLQPGDRVVTSSMEHNAVTRPLRALQRQGVEVIKVPADALGQIDPAAVMAACRGNTRLLVLSHCSNVTGAVQPIATLGSWCRRQGILFLVDAAQSAGAIPIDVEAMGIDLLAVAGHKSMLGPQGTGLLYVREGVRLAPRIYGGTGSDSDSEAPPEQMPERFEAGTLNTPGIAGLKAAVEFIRQAGLARIHDHESALLGQLLSGLAAIDGVDVYGPMNPDVHGGAVSFNLRGWDPARVGFLLDRDHDIVCRVGLHCAPDAHRTIGTFPQGTVRISPGYFNTPEDIKKLLAALAVLVAKT
ncbi:MAG: aminotransferase class V-fold PLP-dependent enzyme, partial [Desulfuromonadaceae bacterium]